MRSQYLMFSYGIVGLHTARLLKQSSSFLFFAFFPKEKLGWLHLIGHNGVVGNVRVQEPFDEGFESQSFKNFWGHFPLFSLRGAGKKVVRNI